MSIADFSKLGAIKRLLAGRSDDTVDKLHNSTTTTVLVILATVVTTGIFVGDPIQCWLPAEFPENRAPYVKQHCWIKNTYYIPFDDVIPVNNKDRTDAEVTYYQWIPMILLFMALLFKIPLFIWRHYHRTSGVNISRLSEMADDCICSTKQERDDRISHLADVINHWLCLKNYDVGADEKSQQYKKYRRNFRQTFLIRLYIFVKCLYFVNVIGQLYLLKLFLAMDLPKLANDILHIFSQSSYWEGSRTFPRQTYCDFNIRQLQNVQRYTLQCILPINLFNEKIFVLLWFWLLLLSVITGISLLYWMWFLFYRRNNFTNIKNYLKMKKVSEETIRKLKHRLGDDGCFVIRMVSLNAEGLAVKYLLEGLLQSLESEKPKLKQHSDILNMESDV